MAEIDDVAAAILAHTGSITAMKLQKLIYYSQAWHLVREGRRLFADPVQAWQQGPVVPSVYAKHRGVYRLSAWPDGHAERLKPKERATLEWVLGRYSAFSAETLSRLTHSEVPWLAARESRGPGEKGTEEITPEGMRHYYGRQIADVETAVAHAAASSALEGVELDEDWQDVLRAVAGGSRSADEVIAREIERARRL